MPNALSARHLGRIGGGLAFAATRPVRFAKGGVRSEAPTWVRVAGVETLRMLARGS